MVSAFTYLSAMLEHGRITNKEFDARVANLFRSGSSSMNTRSLHGHSKGYVSTSPSTSGSSPSKSRDTVLNTHELLEMILTKLPRKDLMRTIPLVCHGFHTALRTSHHIRRRTFRQPDWTPQQTQENLPLYRTQELIKYERGWLNPPKFDRGKPATKRPLLIYRAFCLAKSSDQRITRPDWQPHTLVLSQPPPQALHVVFEHTDVEVVMRYRTGITLMHIEILRELQKMRILVNCYLPMLAIYRVESDEQKEACQHLKVFDLETSQGGWDAIWGPLVRYHRQLVEEKHAEDDGSSWLDLTPTPYVGDAVQGVCKALREKAFSDDMLLGRNGWRTPEPVQIK